MRRTNMLPSAALLALAVALHSGVADAHPPLFTDQDSENRAAELLKKGNALSRAGKLAEALEAYTAAWRIQESYAGAANLGNLELNLEKYRDAAEHLAFAIRSFPSDGKPAVREALHRGLDEAKKHVGTLRVHVNVVAQVALDGKHADVVLGDGELFVEPGRHALEASQAGYTSKRKDVLIAAGEARYVDFELVAAQAAAVPLAPPPDPQRPPHERTKVPAIVGGALAGLGLVLGTGFTIAANQRSSAATALRTKIVAMRGHPLCPGSAQPLIDDCAQLKSDVVQRDTFSNAAVWSFVAAGAFAIGSGAYLLWATRTSKPVATARIRIAPSPSPRGGALLLTGDF